MKPIAYNKQFMKLTKKDSLEKMLVVLDTILMFMSIQEQEPIFAEKNLP
jgi:hypothetical protein